MTNISFGANQQAALQALKENDKETNNENIIENSTEGDNNPVTQNPLKANKDILKAQTSGKNSNIQQRGGEGLTSLQNAIAKMDSAIEQSSGKGYVLQQTAETEEGSINQKGRFYNDDPNSGHNSLFNFSSQTMGKNSEQIARSTSGNIKQKADDDVSKEHAPKRIYQIATTDKGTIKQDFENKDIQSYQTATTKNPEVIQNTETRNSADQKIFISDSNKNTDKGFRQYANRARLSFQDVKLTNSNHVKGKQVGGYGQSFLDSSLENSSNNTINQDGRAGDDYINSVFKNNSNNNITTINGGLGNDRINVELNQSSDNIIKIYGSSEHRTRDDEIDRININLNKVDLTKPDNNIIFINAGVIGEYNDRVIINLPDDVDPGTVKYDRSTNVIRFNGNEIHLGVTTRTVELISPQYETYNDAINNIKNDPSLSKERKESKIESIKNSYDENSKIYMRNNKRLINVKSDPLPDKIKNLVVKKSANEARNKEFMHNMAKVYSDPEGKLLLEKLVENGTTIEIADNAEFDKDQTVGGYFTSKANKIVIRSDQTSYPSLLVHEMGHAVTGVGGKVIDSPTLSLLCPGYLLYDVLSGSQDETKINDGNSFKEEIGTDLMAEEITKRINGEVFTKKEAESHAKLHLRTMLSIGGDATDSYAPLKEDNGFYNNIKKVTDVDVDFDVDPKSLYEELKKEDTEHKIARAPHLEA